MSVGLGSMAPGHMAAGLAGLAEEPGEMERARVRESMCVMCVDSEAWL